MRPILIALSLFAFAACAAPMTPMPTPTQDVDPITIVTLGDSLTEGDKDDSKDGGGWPRRIRSILAAQRPGSRVINFARAGWTSTDLLRGANGEPNQIDRAVDELRRAAGDKIVTVWIGTNDLFYPYEFGDPTPDEERADRDRFNNNLDETLRRLSETDARMFIALLHDPSQGLVQTSGVFMSTTAKEWAQMSQQAQRYNEIITAVAAKYRAALVDIPATKIFITPALMYEDGIHPNARGYDALADVWLKMLSSR